MRNMAKRAISLLCVISMLLSMMITVQAAGVGIAVENITLQQGSGTETVEVPIKISNNTGILGMTLQLEYGEGLTLTNVVKGDALTSLSFTKPGNFTDNPVKMVWDGESENDTSNGTIATLTFTVSKDTVKDYSIDITTKGVFDENLDDVVVTTTNGKISVVGNEPVEPDEPTTGTTITAPEKTVANGSGTETVEYPITIAGNTGILGMTLQLEYGEGLTLTNVVKGEALASLSFTKPGNFTDNPVKMVWDGESENDTSNGVVATLTFDVPKGTAKEYPITLTTKGVFDENLDDVVVTTVNGKIVVGGGGVVEPVIGTTISAPEKSIDQGSGTETVEVPITIAGNTGILGMTLQLEYGEGLTLTNVVKGDALASLSFTKPGNFTDNPVKMVWDGESENDTSNGVVATLTFDVPKGTAKEYPITLTTKGVFDENLDDVVVTTKAGKIVVVAQAHTHDYGDWVKADDTNHKKTCECGDVVTEAHKWDAGQVTTAATHTKDGVKTYTCTECKATKTEVIPADADNHTFGKWSKVDDNKHSRECACGKTETADHGWNDGVVTTQATHTKEGVKTYTCADCGATKTEAVAKLEGHTYGDWEKADDTNHKKTCECGDVVTETHKWDAGQVTTAATHTKDGVKTYTCTECKATKTEVIPADADNHTFGKWSKVDDNKHSRECACGKTETADHNWNDGVVTTQPTHAKDGVKTYTCSDCKAVKTEVVEKIAHSYSDWTNLNETLHKRECTCGNVQTAEHMWNNATVTVEPTHTSYGVRTYTCKACKATKTEKIDKLSGHTYGEWTKRDDNSHLRECACGMMEISAHDWDAGQVTKAATHTTTGIKTYTCSVCKATKEEILDKIPGHSFSDWTKVDNKNHKRTCGCGEEEIAVHTWDDGEITKEPTETTTGTRVHTCSVCNATKTEELPVLTHKHTLNKTNAKAATCTDAGNIEYYTCSGCKKKFKNANGTDEVQNVEIAALGHSAGKYVAKVEPTCNKNGRLAYYECANEGCKVKFADEQATIKLTNLTIPKAHTSLVEIPGFEATCTHVGLSTGQKCTACNVVIVKQAVIPKLTHSLTEVAEIPATCEANGTKGYHICSGCGKKFTSASATEEITELVIPALGHNYGAWEVTTPAGPGVNGEKTRVCQNNSNHIETAVIPALDGVCANVDNHSVAEFKVKVEATCTTNGQKQRYCDTCGEFVGETVEIPAAHQHEDVSATPNCLVDGIKAHKHCSVCGKNFINGTEVNSVVAPAKGEHTWSEYVNDVATCTVCGETKKFVYTTTTDAKLDVEDLDSALTETDNSLIDAGLDIKHEMNVEDVDTPSTELSDELENKGFDSHEKFIVDITIDKHVTNGSTITYKEEVKETEELMAIEFVLPSSLRNKLNYFLLRVHEGVADEITTTPNAHGEYIVLDLVNHKLTMYVKFFSEYAIFADGEATTPSTPHYGGSSVSRYTVKFESNGGSTVKSVTVNRNTVATEPTAPTKDGYKFDGWYTDKELTSKYDFTAKVTKNITLYAKWVEVKEGDESTEDKWFVDVEENDWFYASVKYVVDNNLMNGISDSEFAPNDTLTRAMLVTVLYRNEGEPATNRSIPFADVDMGSYYGNAVSWAKQNGIVSGVTENSFAPDTNITREQIATIMFRYAQYKGMNAVTLEENLHFTDSSEISDYAVSAMNWAVGTGLMKGKSATTINPKDNATRAEIAAILQRFIEANK